MPNDDGLVKYINDISGFDYKDALNRFIGSYHSLTLPRVANLDYEIKLISEDDYNITIYISDKDIIYKEEKELIIKKNKNDSIYEIITVNGKYSTKIEHYERRKKGLVCISINENNASNLVDMKTNLIHKEYIPDFDSASLDYIISNLKEKHEAKSSFRHELEIYRSDVTYNLFMKTYSFPYSIFDLSLLPKYGCFDYIIDVVKDPKSKKINFINYYLNDTYKENGMVSQFFTKSHDVFLLPDLKLINNYIDKVFGSIDEEFDLYNYTHEYLIKLFKIIKPYQQIDEDELKLCKKVI